MAFEVRVRKWGNSMGIVLPKEIVEEKRIKDKDKVAVEIVKEANLTEFFGALKRKMSGQKFKDLARKGWEP